MGDMTFGSPRGGSTATGATGKEEQTKSMKKYMKDLEFKNRVIKEKEKAVYN